MLIARLRTWFSPLIDSERSPKSAALSVRGKVCLQVKVMSSCALQKNDKSRFEYLLDLRTSVDQTLPVEERCQSLRREIKTGDKWSSHEPPLGIRPRPRLPVALTWWTSWRVRRSWRRTWPVNCGQLHCTCRSLSHRRATNEQNTRTEPWEAPDRRRKRPADALAPQFLISISLHLESLIAMIRASGFTNTRTRSRYNLKVSTGTAVNLQRVRPLTKVVLSSLRFLQSGLLNLQKWYPF